MTADPGATPTAARALAPDLARGGMLLLIALANVQIYRYGHPPDPDGADRAVALAQALLVQGRAYPLFGLLFGYGIVQLAWRRSAVGLPAGAVVRLVRRRGAWLVAIGLLHGVLLWSGDIVGAYGLLALLMAGPLVRGTDRGLLATAAAGAVLIALVNSPSGVAEPGGAESDAAVLPSVAAADPGTALGLRAVEWVTVGLLVQALAVFGAVALGAWAARRRILDEPERHHPLLRRAAVAGLAAAVLGGLPMALAAAGLWTAPSLPVALLIGALHTLAGYAGGIGYAALFGLLAIRLGRGGGPGRVPHAVRACGQRSLSCYLAQSVAFVALLPAWSSGLGDGARPWQAALVGAGAWVVILLVAAASERAGHRGPAELALRRLTYGRQRAPQA